MRLTADIGGTNIRFALSPQPGILQHTVSLKISEIDSFTRALQEYRDKHAPGIAISQAAIAAAGPVSNDEVVMTNVSWTLHTANISAQLGGADTTLVNDLEAVARAIPELTPNDAIYLRAATTPDHARTRRLAINVGTGFGAACVIKTPDGYITAPTEAGHMLQTVRDTTDPDQQTVEDFLSGHGIFEYYKKLDKNGPAADSTDIFSAPDSDTAALRTRLQISAMLGRAAHNLTLAHAAWDGIYLVGGVIDGWAAAAIKDPALLERFLGAYDNPGPKPSPMHTQLHATPVAIIKRPQVALYGLSFL